MKLTFKSFAATAAALIVCAVGSTSYATSHNSYAHPTTTDAKSLQQYWIQLFRNYHGYRANKPTQSITEIVAASGGDFDSNNNDYDILLNAVLTAGLDAALADASADLTVFAPNDKAFIRLANDFGFEGNDEAGAFNAIVAALTELGNDDPIPLLTDVLLYHVSPDAKRLRTIKRAHEVETLLEGAILLPAGNQLVDNEPDLRNPRFVRNATDIRATNGIIHTINRVLIPLDIPGNEGETTSSTITDIVVASGGQFDNNLRDFDILLNAVTTAGLADTLANPAANLTVFAPNDAAFIRLARDLGYAGYDEAGAFTAIVEILTVLGNDDPIPVLTNLLLYHVSADRKDVREVISSDTINTLLEGSSFNPKGRRLQDGAPRLRDPAILIRNSNIEATNGIIHVINRVLIPIPLDPVRGH